MDVAGRRKLDSPESEPWIALAIAADDEGVVPEEADRRFGQQVRAQRQELAGFPGMAGVAEGVLRLGSGFVARSAFGGLALAMLAAGTELVAAVPGLETEIGP